MRAVSLLSLMVIGVAGASPAHALEIRANPGPAAPVRVESRSFVAADPTAPMFDPAHVLEIDIQMNADQWNQLCAQQRTLVSLFRGSCFAQPFASPFTWFPAVVSIDGQERLNAGIRKKGFVGSLDPIKPSLKIDLTEFQPNSAVYGTKKLTLNNARQDPSLVRQCIGYQLFALAGVVAPRCNFAHVTVNEKDLGIYVNVEDVRKPMIARHFADNSGNLYEGTISDFHPALVNTFEAQTNEAANDRSDIDAVITALGASDGDLVDQLGAVVDLDAFVRFWVAEALVGHWDGYSSNRNNFYMYDDPVSGKFYFIPWGADVILADGHPQASLDATANKAIFAYSALTRRLVDLPDVRSRYVAEMQRQLDSVWNEGAILAEIDRMSALLAPYVGDLSVQTAPVRTFVAGQRGQIKEALGNGVPAFPPLTIVDFCLVRHGSVAGTFEASWGTVEKAPYKTGTATVQAVFDGYRFAGEGGAGAGLSAANPNPHLGYVHLYLKMTNGVRAAIKLNVDPSRLVPGATLVIDGQQVDAAFTTVGFLDEGKIKLTEASTQPGGKIRGAFEAGIFRFSGATLAGSALPTGLQDALASFGGQLQP